MPVLIVGKTEILYTVRRSEKAKRKRIIVTPGQVEIVAPVTSEEAEIETFAHQQRRWIFEKREEVETKAKARQMENPGPSRFVSGAKIPYRGRQLRLTVQKGESDQIEVSYRHGFVVSIPSSLPAQDRDGAIAEALTFWLKDRVAQDVAGFVRHYSRRLGVQPKGVRIKEQKHLWGSCSRGEMLNFNWHLIFAPRPVLEYAVVHELCHLVHRNHSPGFWALVGSQLSGYETCRKWLEDHEQILSF